MVNYGIVYGLSDYGLADRLKSRARRRKSSSTRYLDALPARRARSSTTTIAQATDEGYVTTLFGRRRQIPELRARNYQVRSLGERLAVNTVIQGTAADVIKLAMVGARRARCADEGLATRLILRSTTSCCSRARPRRRSAPRALAEREMVAPGATATRRSPSTPASARPGWRRSRWTARAAAILVVAAGPRSARRRRSTRSSAHSVGTFPAATIIFAIGTALLLAIVAITGGVGG